MQVSPSNMNSQIFQVLSDEDEMKIPQEPHEKQNRVQLKDSPFNFRKNLPSYHCDCEAKNATIIQLHKYIIELQIKNKQMIQRLSQMQRSVTYLSAEGINYAKRILQMQAQIQEKNQQIENFKKQQAEKNQKYIIIESEDSCKETDKKNLKKGRYGVEFKQSIEADVMANLLLQANEAKRRQSFTIQQNMQKHLINYVLQLSKNNSDKENLQNLLQNEKERMIEYLKNFNVMMEPEKGVWNNWVGFKAIANLFRS